MNWSEPLEQSLMFWVCVHGTTSDDSILNAFTDISLTCLLKHSIFKKGPSGSYQNNEYSDFLRKGTKDSIKELIEFT